MRALAMVGVLESRVGDGTYVTTLQPELLLTGVGFVSDLMSVSSLQIHQIRRLLEPEATRLAAPRLSPRISSAWRSASSGWRAPRRAGFIEADTAFHKVILVRAGTRPWHR